MNAIDGGVLVAMYHYIRDNADGDGIKALRVADFRAQLDWLASGREVLHFDAVQHALERRESCDGAALLTFDDGFADHYEVAFHELRARGWSGVFFLLGATLADPPRVLDVHKTHLLMSHLGAARFAEEVRHTLAHQPVAAGGALERTDAVYRYDGAASDAGIKHLLNYELPYAVVTDVLGELFARHLGDESDFARRFYLTADQIREMAAAGMVFGFHTVQHRIMSRLTPAGQRTELAHGVDRIRQLTGQQAVPFCYPYGHEHTYNADTLSLLAEGGYASAFNTVRRLADTVRDQRYELPRFDTRDLPPFASTYA